MDRIDHGAYVIGQALADAMEREALAQEQLAARRKARHARASQRRRLEDRTWAASQRDEDPVTA